MSHEGVSHHRRLDHSFGKEIKSFGGPNTNQSKRRGDWGRPNNHFGREIMCLGGPKGAECTMNQEPAEAVAVQQPTTSFKNPTTSQGHKIPGRFPKVRSVQLTARDLLIFQLLQASGAKTSADLSNQFWDGHSKKAKAGFQRIRLLIRFGFLERGNPKLLYLSESTKQILSTALGVEDKKPQ